MGGVSGSPDYTMCFRGAADDQGSMHWLGLPVQIRATQKDRGDRPEATTAELPCAQRDSPISGHKCAQFLTTRTASAIPSTIARTGVSVDSSVSSSTTME